MGKSDGLIEVVERKDGLDIKEKEFTQELSEAKAVEDEANEDAALYVVAVGYRGKVARLHRRDGCYRGRQLTFKDYELVYEDPPPAASYTDFCRSCWPSGTPNVKYLELQSEVSEEGSTSSSSGTEKEAP